MSSNMQRAREARDYLANDLGVTIEKFTAYRFTGRRVFELDIADLHLNVDHLLTIASQSGLRAVPVTSVQVWVDTAAETAEADERVLLGEEVLSRFGLQADIWHTADIHPSKVDAFTADFNARLREAWAQRGVPADIPDNYFDRCAEAGMTPEQCAVSWADGPPLDYIS